MAVKKSTTSESKKATNVQKKAPKTTVEAKSTSVAKDLTPSIVSEAEANPNANFASMDSIAFNTKDIIESLKKVDTTIKSEPNTDVLIEEIKEAMKPIQEIREETQAINDRYESFAKEIEEHPEDAEKIASQELQKAEALKAKLEKSLEKVKSQINTTKTVFPTQWWNGIKIE